MRKTIQTQTQRKRDVHFLDETLSKTKVWLKEMQSELHLDNEHDAYSSLCAVLHALRDRLSVNEAVQLGAQLPTLIRGVYYESWNPNDKPQRIRDAQEFLDGIAEKLEKGRLARGPNTLYITEGIIKVLEKKITQGEMDDIKATLPKDILKLWPKMQQHVKSSQKQHGDVPIWDQPESGTRR